MFRKPLGIACQERRNIIGNQIDLSANLFGLSRIKTTEAKIGMKTTSHPLKEFLVWLPGGREYQLLVPAEGANQSIVWD